MQSIVSITCHVLTHWLLITTLCSRYYFYPHVAVRKPRPEEVQELFQGLTASRWQKWDLYRGGLAPDYVFSTTMQRSLKRQRKGLPKVFSLHGGTLINPKDKGILYKLPNEAGFWEAWARTKKVRTEPLTSNLHAVDGVALGGDLGGLQSTEFWAHSLPFSASVCPTYSSGSLG